MTTVIPSLHNGPTDILTDMQKKLWSVIAFSFNNPGSISNVIEPELISFRKINAEYGNNRDQLAAEYERQLSTVLRNIFPNDNLVVNVAVDIIDEVNFKLNINISSGATVLLLAPIPIGHDSVQITNWNMVI